MCTLVLAPLLVSTEVLNWYRVTSFYVTLLPLWAAVILLEFCESLLSSPWSYYTRYIPSSSSIVKYYPSFFLSVCSLFVCQHSAYLLAFPVRLFMCWRRSVVGFLFWDYSLRAVKTYTTSKCSFILLHKQKCNKH